MLSQPMSQGFSSRDAVALFRAQDWTGARGRLEELAAAGRADAETFAMLAETRRHLGDLVAAHAAVDQALALDAHNLRATVNKAELLTAQGALREANVYNGRVLQLAGAATSLPPDIADGVARARKARARVQAEMIDLVQAELKSAGYSERRSPARFTHALDILTGRKQPYFQQPTAFYYPELPHLQFYPREQMPWLEAVEAATGAMREELDALLRDGGAFSPYQHAMPHMVHQDHPLLNSMDWSTCFLWENGRETGNAARCPRTMAALAEAPLCRVRARSPEVMFSQLRPGAHIPSHSGPLNTRLVCHVPLIVPPNCRFRVGNDIRPWEQGKAWVFDDSIDHEAHNGSDETRVVLIFDIWRPELNEEERVLIATLLEAMDSYSPV